MLPISISEASTSRAVITVRTIFRALVTFSICFEASWRSKVRPRTGESACRCPFASFSAAFDRRQVGGVVGGDPEALRQRVFVQLRGQFVGFLDAERFAQFGQRLRFW